jgi:hypothetical protein
MDELEKKKKMLMIEYILTNGTLPGFFERVQESKPN